MDRIFRINDKYINFEAIAHRLTQGESNVDLLTITGPRMYDGRLDMTTLSWYMRGINRDHDVLVESGLSHTETGDEITFSWKIGPEFCACSGKLDLLLVGKNDAQQEVIKITSSGVTVRESPDAGTAPPRNIFEAALSDLEHILAQVSVQTQTATEASGAAVSSAAQAASSARTATEAADTANTSKNAAKQSADTAEVAKATAVQKADATAAAEVAAAESAQAAKDSAAKAAASQTAARDSETAAAASAASAGTKAAEAAGSAASAAESSTAADAAARAAAASQTAAKASETAAKASENAAKTQADLSKQYADLAGSIAQGQQGYFATPDALRKAVPTGTAGDWAIVGATDSIWVWDVEGGAWVDSHQGMELTNYYTRTETDAAFLARTEMATDADIDAILAS